MEEDVDWVLISIPLNTVHREWRRFAKVTKWASAFLYVSGTGLATFYYSVALPQIKPDFFRAMHFSAKRGITIAWCLSVCL